MFDGGLVKEAIKSPRGEGLFAVRAVWTGISIDAHVKARPIIHQIKNDIFVGTWKLVGIESHSKVPREIVVILEPDDVTETIKSGDVLILGGGAVSKYGTNLIEPKPESTQAVEVGNDNLGGILAPDPQLGTELLVFHSQADDITAQDLIVIKSLVKNYVGEFAYIGTTIARYTLEFRLSGKAVAARSVIDMLSPIRSFVLDASEEMCLDIPRKGGRRAASESELFEPVITAKAASFRFRVHPSSSSRTGHLETSKPLKLLSDVLKRANSGDMLGMRKALEENLKSVDESLKQIEAIVKTARKLKVEFRATDARTPIALGNRALNTIQSAETIKKRTEKVEGDIYAVDLHRGWCRVSTSDTSPQEDWKLDFADDLKDAVRGRYPSA